MRKIIMPLLMLLAFQIVFVSTAYTESYNTGEYYQSDVEVINQIIENNGLALEPNSPDSWTENVTWDIWTPKRITNLAISNQDLTGNLDVSGLTELRQLICSENSLTGIDVSGLSNLERLNCHSNLLTEIDVSGLDSLHTLDCGYNNLSELDVSGLTNLLQLYCFENNLSELNISGLITLQYLYCGGNNLSELDVSTLRACLKSFQ